MEVPDRRRLMRQKFHCGIQEVQPEHNLRFCAVRMSTIAARLVKHFNHVNRQGTSPACLGWWLYAPAVSYCLRLTSLNLSGLALPVQASVTLSTSSPEFPTAIANLHTITLPVSLSQRHSWKVNH